MSVDGWPWQTQPRLNEMWGVNAMEQYLALEDKVIVILATTGMGSEAMCLMEQTSHERTASV